MAVFHNLVPADKKDLLAKEEYLKRLEIIYDNETWLDIQRMVNQVTDMNPNEQIVLNIIDYVNEHRKISFKQWKVLRMFLKENNPDKKFKYGR